MCSCRSLGWAGKANSSEVADGWADEVKMCKFFFFILLVANH
jgi:hypothetical protein